MGKKWGKYGVFKIYIFFKKTCYIISTCFMFFLCYSFALGAEKLMQSLAWYSPNSLHDYSKQTRKIEKCWITDQRSVMGSFAKCPKALYPKSSWVSGDSSQLKHWKTCQKRPHYLQEILKGTQKKRKKKPKKPKKKKNNSHIKQNATYFFFFFGGVYHKEKLNWKKEGN